MTGGWDRLTPEGEKFFRQIDELQDKEVFVGFQAGKVTNSYVERTGNFDRAVPAISAQER